jgi:NAD+ synthase (glutamine-hydrolysing)
LGIDHRVIEIDPMRAAFDAALAPAFNALPTDTTEQNLQARIRGTLLMALSNKLGWLVLATGNKSEYAVGYATLYGDMVGGFAPLKDTSKTWVYRLAAWRNRSGEVIPQRIIDRPPTAELAPGQFDQDTLPPYDRLDHMVELLVEQECSPEEVVAAGFDPIEVKQVVGMIRTSEYKRRQAAPGIRITGRAFGRDRRYPITSGYR